MEYEHITELVKQGRNIFITGSAGTGKSYILNLLKRDFPDLIVTASTGAAAVNVGGTTIHSFAGIGIAEDPADRCCFRMREETRDRIYSCSILAIDEISMLNAQAFDLIDEVFQMIRGKREPFGGVQLIVVGDFLQLPPVSTPERPADFSFNSRAWKDANFANIILEHIYRQDDITFLNILSKVRHGEISQDDINILRANSTPEDNFIHLYARNKEAAAFNMIKLNALPGRPYYFRADDVGKNGNILMIDKYCLAPKDLYLKVGAKVMLLINADIYAGLINGSTGEVLAINPSTSEVQIKFDNGIIATFSKVIVSKITIGGEVVAYREQLPLRLAWAISIHKSQGMTLNRVKIDMNGIFENGQAYVALSRAKNLQGLYVNNLTQDCIKAHPEAVKFLETLKGN